jgi:hypothetical protein
VTLAPARGCTRTSGLASHSRTPSREPLKQVCLGVKPPCGWPKTSFLLLSDSFGLFDMRRPPRREDGSIVYNCYRSSPAQSFSGPSPAGLMTIFYCLGFETPQTRRARSPCLYPPGKGWPRYTPRHWVPFLSPPTTRRAKVEVFQPSWQR